MLSATQSSRPTRSCLTRSAARASIHSIRYACSSGSRTAVETLVRCAGTLSNTLGRILKGGNEVGSGESCKVSGKGAIEIGLEEHASCV